MNIEAAADITTHTEMLPSLDKIYADGAAFAKEHLQEIFPLLLERVQKEMSERGLHPEEVQFIFLDRDARPSLHAWQAFTDHRFSSIPLVVSRSQFQWLATAFGHYFWNEVSGTPFTPSEISDEFKKYILKGILRGENKKGQTNTLDWMYALSKILMPKLRHKKHVVIVDTGYMGSMLFMAEYIVSHLVPNTNERTTDSVMFFGNNQVSAADYLKFGGSEKLEGQIPHATTGYSLNRENYAIKYTRDPERIAAERAYIRGCVDGIREVVASEKKS